MCYQTKKTIRLKPFTMLMVLLVCIRTTTGFMLNIGSPDCSCNESCCKTAPIPYSITPAHADLRHLPVTEPDVFSCQDVVPENSENHGSALSQQHDCDGSPHTDCHCQVHSFTTTLLEPATGVSVLYAAHLPCVSPALYSELVPHQATGNTHAELLPHSSLSLHIQSTILRI